MKKRYNAEGTLALSAGCGIGGKGYDKKFILEVLPRHTACTPSLLKRLEKCEESVIRNSGNAFAKKITAMVREIFRERERTRQFTRTTLHPAGILSGTVAITHQIEDLVADFFHQRFPQYIICLFNEIRKETIVSTENGSLYLLSEPLDRVVARLSKDREKIAFFEDVQYSTDELFEVFYISQFVEERENRPYFRKMIPKECMDLPGMRGGVERRFRNKGLDQFLS